MNDHPDRLEDLLLHYLPAAPPAQLRDRILAASDAATPTQRHAVGWPAFLAAMAAVVLLGLNLASISASATGLLDPMRLRSAQVQAASQRLRELDPDLTEQDAQALAYSLLLRGRLATVPLVRGSQALTLHNPENPS